LLAGADVGLNLEDIAGKMKETSERLICTAIVDFGVDA
jgi:hypothetical protein